MPNPTTGAKDVKATIDSQSSPGSFIDRDYSIFERLQLVIFKLIFFSVSLILHIGGFPLRSFIIASVGTLIGLLMRKTRRTMKINLDIAFGNEYSEKRKQEIIRGCFRHFVRVGLDSLFLEVYFPRKRLKQIEIEGIEYFREALEGGRGFCGVTGHLGNWEIGGAAMIDRGIPMAVIYKRVSSPIFDWIVGQKRINSGVDLLEVPEKKKGSTTRKSLGPEIEKILLEKNGSVNFLFDQYATGAKKSVDIPVFGTDAPTHIGVVHYALKCNSPCVIGVCVYEGNTCKIIGFPPIHLESKGTEEETHKFWLNELNKIWEELIRKYPEQWAWGHRRYYRENYK
jgi:Kdo2-lipid IVA lauroyltransferase/acyltransferase